jgi:carbohydrate kinase (thermoresistant glucokinase family)
MAASPRRSERARIIIVMGVSSSGKSTVGAALGARLGKPFLDGDAYHPASNVEKMRSGTPLTDADRWPWLERLAAALKVAADRNGAAIGACSALKRAYRDFLTQKAGEPVLFVFLKGDRALIGARMAARRHEYMPASLLDSQFATLEPPDPDENALTVPVAEPVEAILDRVVGALA